MMDAGGMSWLIRTIKVNAQTENRHEPLDTHSPDGVGMRANTG